MGPQWSDIEAKARGQFHLRDKILGLFRPVVCVFEGGGGVEEEEALYARIQSALEKMYF